VVGVSFHQKYKVLLPLHQIIMSKEYRRRAHHAGSWYEDDSQDLSETLDAFLSETETPSTEGAAGLPRGIIAPHAGYSYSGPTAAHAYMHLKEALMRGWNGTVVVLHPSHHAYLDGCAVSGKKYYFSDKS
jgi:AmmeMemoRadiSam system protein B